MGLISKKCVCRQGRAGFPGRLCLRVLSHDPPLAQHCFTISLGVHLHQAHSKKKPKPGLATCFFGVLNTKMNCSKYERKQS